MADSVLKAGGAGVDPPEQTQPRIYTSLADWYPLLTTADEAMEEAAFFLRVFREALGTTPGSVLELGCGAGNLAYHYKHTVVEVTLTDLSPAMLAQSQRQNPECAHLSGDMRTLRLERTFDAVFAHDAVCYLTTEADLRAAMETAFLHLRAGGVAVFAPDHVRDNFAESLEADGHDDGERSLRYLMRTWDPEPADDTYVVDFAYLLRDGSQPVRCVQDRHVEGLFERATWLRLLAAVGFERVTVRPLEHSDVPLGSVELFVATKPLGSPGAPVR